VPACDSVANIEPMSAIEETDAVPVVPEHEQQSTGIEEADITAPMETEANDSDAKSTTKSTHSSDDVDSINHEFGDELFIITSDTNVEAFNNQKYTKRNKRDVMSNHFHVRSDSRRFREDRLIQLELPCHDNYCTSPFLSRVMMRPMTMESRRRNGPTVMHGTPREIFITM
jgi:hypothetical protein